jgi:hypothetical protein
MRNTQTTQFIAALGHILANIEVMAPGLGSVHSFPIMNPYNAPGTF